MELSRVFDTSLAKPEKEYLCVLKEFPKPSVPLHQEDNAEREVNAKD